MAYCSIATLQTTAATVVELTDDERKVTDPTDLTAATTQNPEIATRVSAAIAAADAVIDGHIRAHYDVPLSPTPDLIAEISAHLTLYRLHCRRPQLALPEYVVENKDDAMRMLVAMRDGKMDLGVEPPPAESSASAADTDGPERVFTTDTLEGF